MLEQRVDELRGEEAYQVCMSSFRSSLWRDEEMRDEGMSINGDSSSAFIQTLLALYIRTVTVQ